MSEASKKINTLILSQKIFSAAQPADNLDRNFICVQCLKGGREGWGLHIDWQLVFQKLAFNFRWTPFLPIAFVAICFKSEIESCFLLWITSRKSALINLLIFGPHFVPMTFFRNAKAIWVNNNVHKFYQKALYAMCLVTRWFGWSARQRTIKFETRYGFAWRCLKWC